MNSNLLKCEFENCTKTYGRTFNLKRHIDIVHLGLRKFNCDICGRCLSSKQNLLDHKNVHTGDKPYVCDYSGCKQSFRQLCQLYVHRQLHKGIEVYSNNNIVSKNLLTLLTTRITEETSKKDWEKLEPGTPVENLPKIEGRKEAVKLPRLEILNN